MLPVSAMKAGPQPEQRELAVPPALTSYSRLSGQCCTGARSQSGQHMWTQGPTVFKRGKPSSRPTGGGVIEITFRVRLVKKTVEITEVVAQMGDGIFRARKRC